MKLHWVGTATRTVELGASVRGARLDGYRPQSVEFTQKEVEMLLLQITSDHPAVVSSAHRYLEELKNSLSKEYIEV
jgi:hypothetical protein